MSAFGDFAREFARGIVSEVTRHAREKIHAYTLNAHDPGAVERLCGQLGWTVDERNGNAAILHFNDPATGVRKLSVLSDGATVVFVVNSGAELTAVPQVVTEYLLARNARLDIGRWAMESDGRCIVVGLMHRAQLDGLDAAGFRFICEALVLEVQNLDARMRAAGLLQ